MKCISLWQPWATLIALGHKRIETRSWPTSHRGPIAIHAAKRRLDHGGIQLINTHFVAGCELRRLASTTEGLPLGSIVATARLHACFQFTVEALNSGRWVRIERERAFGDFALGRWGWVLDEVQPLATPIPYTGRQGLFEVPDTLFARGAE